MPEAKDMEMKKARRGVASDWPLIYPTSKGDTCKMAGAQQDTQNTPQYRRCNGNCRRGFHSP
jgi:hypothetical protein